jgi:hypothetical protein
MPRVRIDLRKEAYDALAARAIAERRPVDWQAEVLIESGLGLRDRPTTPNDSSSTEQTTRIVERREAIDAVA